MKEGNIDAVSVVPLRIEVSCWIDYPDHDRRLQGFGDSRECIMGNLASCGPWTTENQWDHAYRDASIGSAIFRMMIGEDVEGPLSEVNLDSDHEPTKKRSRRTPKKKIKA